MTLVDKLSNKLNDLDLKEKHEDRGLDYQPQSYTHPQQTPLPYPEEDHMNPYTLRPHSHTQPSSYQYHQPRPTPSNLPLPKGWISLWDQRYQRTYYANQSTGQTQWEVPREERRWEYLYRTRCPLRSNGKVYKAYHPSVYRDRVESHSPVMAAAGGVAVGGAADEYSDSDYSDSDYEEKDEPASEPEDNDEGLSKLNEGLQKFADALSQFSS